jgi:hypothetical protein
VREAVAADSERRTNALRARADYPPLLQSLEEILETEANRPVDRQALEECIATACAIYETNHKVSDWLSRFTLHELAAPLASVIHILEREANRGSILLALHQRTEKMALARYENLLRDLHKIARIVPSVPEKRGKGAPAKSDDLFIVVRFLARYWEEATGKRFKQSWHKGSPINAAVRFVHALISFIDRDRLRALPKVTERLVTERRRFSDE